jgi:hypothetical protein
MRVIISDHYENARHVIEGDDEDVRSQVLDLYPYLLTKYGPHCDINILVKDLNHSQFASAVVLNDLDKSDRYDTPGIIQDGIGQHVIRYPSSTKHGQIHTQDTQLEACREAGAFLSGHPCEDKEMRQALLQNDGNPELAALAAHGLPLTMLEDLRAVLSSSLKKSEESTQPVKFKDVSSATASGTVFAEIVKKSSDAGEIKHILLGKGKHNHGMLLARDSETHQSCILKPGSGHLPNSGGEQETGATQSTREACFFAVAQAWGLGEYMPECHLLLIDGQEYACSRFLPNSFKNFNDLKAHDPGLPGRLMHLYNDSTLHKWAAMDLILGNPDRNAGNVMASGDKVKLIDHGSTFAGASFDPAKDGISFVPYYLRPSVTEFNSLSTNDKLRKLPRLNAENEAKLRKWILDLNPELMGQIMTQYGIDSGPEKDRLQKLQQALGYQTADLAVLSAWVVG